MTAVGCASAGTPETKTFDLRIPNIKSLFGRRPAPVPAGIRPLGGVAVPAGWTILAKPGIAANVARGAVTAGGINFVFMATGPGNSRKSGSWSSAREKFWMDLAEQEAKHPSGWFSERNLREMADGRAPKIRVKMTRRSTDGTGRTEIRDIPLELHHRTLPQRMGSGAQNEAWNLEIVNRWAHEAMDQYRHAGWELVKILNGPNSW